MHSLSSDYKTRNGVTKLALRTAFKSLIPEKILNRKDKVGFETPAHIWFRDGQIIQTLTNIINSDRFQGRECFDYSKIKAIFDDFQNGNDENISILWKVLYLELWFRIFIDDPKFLLNDS